MAQYAAGRDYVECAAQGGGLEGTPVVLFVIAAASWWRLSCQGHFVVHGRVRTLHTAT